MVYTAFIDHLKFQKRSSVHTVEAYQKDLSDFFQYTSQLYEVEHPAEVSTVIVRSWIADMIEQGMEPKSVSRKVSTLRTFYKYLLRNNELKINPLSKIVVPKIKKRLPVFVDETRMDNLFMHMEEPKTYNQFLEQAIIEMFYATGMRLSELVDLKIKNVDGNTVKVLGKRSKERIIPLTETAREALNAYLRQRNVLEKVVDGDHVFLLETGKKLYQKFVYRIVNTYLARVTTEKKRSPHVLRHTFATHLLNNGAQLNAIKELLGHASLAATQVYTHNTISKLINIHQNAHPLEQKRKAG